MTDGPHDDREGRPAPPPAAPSCNDLAYAEIKHRVITCVYRPGECLSEAAVSAELGYGRTPVHQAFIRLKRDGLVDVLARKGILVRPISLDEVLDIASVRLVNETYCVRLAVERATPRDIAELEQNVTQAGEAARACDIARLMLLDRRFHQVIATGAGNPILAEVLAHLHDRSLRVWFMSLRDAEHHRRVIEEHHAIVAAMRARNPDAAEQAMRAHIAGYRGNIIRQL
ncbi:GntR family transcriptional regulator [Phreatobacter stygius]|uniref:GntR family transcriptional regulator n=1 Tax=Phreatobacter stygius TaxID=1940610 RepID=A0A4D7B2I4_9HYPH|nr:GntR family transcriptional regulator [Phreatobacter stygius]QCI65253.1 GntR family transcriptional regulator [Phreatobacter stygius]